MKQESIRPAIFALDGVGTFGGYTDGKTWNGWSCPIFTAEVAREVLTRVASLFDSNVEEDFYNGAAQWTIFPSRTDTGPVSEPELYMPAVGITEPGTDAPLYVFIGWAWREGR